MNLRVEAVIVFLTLFGLSGNAQDQRYKITALILDSASGNPIEYASMTMYTPGTKAIINGAVSDARGKISLTVPGTGKYDLRVESLGYLALNENREIKPGAASTNLGKLFLSRSVSNLRGVTVLAPTKLIDNRIDKMVFNAEKDLSSQGGVATDILKKIPQVSVDVDGNVELAGSSSVKFLIDGKPSMAFGSNIADVLQSIPASQVKSVEVITNPGAKYDAEGLGGIINIILKHNTIKGINGNLSLTAASRNENASVNVNFRNNNFGVNVFANGNKRLTANTPTSSLRLSHDTAMKTDIAFQQDGSSEFNRYGVEAGVGVDWTPSKKSNLNFALSSNHFGNNSNGYVNQNQTTTNYSSNLTSQLFTLRNTSSHFRISEVNVSLDYKKTFNLEDQELDLGIHSSNGSNNYRSVNEQFYLPGENLFYGTNNSNPGNENETEVVLDYTQPLGKKIKLGTGGKIGIRKIDSRSDVSSLQPDAQEYVYITALSNSLRYRQQVYAAYTELSFPVAKWFDAKLGFRYERTELASYFSNAFRLIAEPGYNTYVPSVFFIRKFESQSLKLSFSKRIERPGYRDLNPFVNTSDPNNVTTGNPYLKPETGFRVELGWTHDLKDGGTFMVSLFDRTNRNDIQPYVVYYANLPVGDTVYTNVSVSTPQNIGTETNIGMNFFAELHPVAKFSLRSNFFVFHRHIANAINQGLNSESWNYRLNINLTYNFNNNLGAEFFGNFNSPRNELQGKYPSFTSYTFAIRQQIWKKKGSIAFTTNNPFNQYVDQSTQITGIGFKTISTRKIPFRSFGFNFTWKFGKLEFKKQKAPDADTGSGNGEG